MASIPTVGHVALPILRVIEHGPDTRSFVLPAPFPRSLPGQFVFAWLPGLGEKPFSISEHHDDELELTVKALGPFSRAMMELEPGDKLGLRGPYGSHFAPAGPAVLLGGGIGIAPIRFLARQLERQGHSAPILLGARSADEHVFVADFGRLGARFATDDGSLGHHGFVTRLLDDLELSADTTLCACGPEPMLVGVARAAESRGLPVQLSMERYMKCGLGICGQCCMDGSGLRCCVEGPVLDDTQLATITELGQPHRDGTGRR
jgi:dihydroorotate dehydrogenase electron transfer subunit